MPGGHEEVKTGRGWGCTGRMRMGQGVAREDRGRQTERERRRKRFERNEVFRRLRFQCALFG